MKKKILFVINTLGHAGAEVALLELLKALDKTKYEISLFVLLGQGELISRVPDDVKLLNNRYKELSVLSGEGKRNMMKTVIKSLFHRGTIISRLPYLIKNIIVMIKKKEILIEVTLCTISV